MFVRQGCIPVLSIDTKKKEPLGTLHRPRQCYSTAPQAVFDHDFSHLADGRLHMQLLTQPHDFVLRDGFALDAAISTRVKLY